MRKIDLSHYEQGLLIQISTLQATVNALSSLTFAHLSTEDRDRLMQDIHVESLRLSVKGLASAGYDSSDVEYEFLQQQIVDAERATAQGLPLPPSQIKMP